MIINLTHSIGCRALRFTAGVVCAALLVAMFSGGPATAQQAALGTPQLQLRTHVTIDSNTVRLSDIFSGAIVAPGNIDGDTIIAYAPAPGRKAVFDAQWLSRIAQRHRLNWRPSTRLDRTVVERASTVVTAEQIADSIQSELKARGAQQDIDLQLSNRSLLVHVEASKPATIEVVNLATDGRNSKFSAIIAIPAGDPQAHRVTVTGKIFQMIEVPVPVASIRPGDVIRAGDVRWKRFRAVDVRNNIVSEMSQIIGREAQRPLGADALVRQSDLRDQVTVSKGANVTMIYRTASMFLTTVGRALEAGGPGDYVPVRNTRTQLVVDARILGPNKVEVVALRQLAANEGSNR